MIERPMLFNSEMVRAILAKSKTQTRRLVKPQPSSVLAQPGEGKAPAHAIINRAPKSGVILNEYGNEDWLRSPYGYTGDRLWVRETVRAEVVNHLAYVRYMADNALVLIENSQEAADDWHDMYCYRGKHGATVPSIHMPRWCNRMTLEITDVRIERLQEISEEDAESEGIDFLRSIPDVDETLTAKALFGALWDSIYHNWDKNPWVWVVEFKLAEVRK